MYIMNNVLIFWVFTLLFALLCLFLSNALCECFNHCQRINDRPYILFQNKNKEMIPIIKIEK
jgi:hypothetical protein